MHKRWMYTLFLISLSIFFLGGQGGCGCGGCCGGEPDYEYPDPPAFEAPNFQPPAYPNVQLPCYMCGTPGCGACPEPTIPGDEEPDPQQNALPMPGTILPPGTIPTSDPDVYLDPTNGNLVHVSGNVVGNVPVTYRPVLSEPGHYLDLRTSNIVDKDGTVIRPASDIEKQHILETTIPSGMYLLPGTGYINPTTLLVHDFSGSIIRAATPEDIAAVKGKAPQGMIDVGYGYADPNTLMLYSYGGKVIRTLTPSEANRLLKRAPQGTFDLGYGYLDKSTGMIHDYFGKALRQPTLDEINQIMQSSSGGTAPPTTPGTNPTVAGIPDITVEEDTTIDDLDLKLYKSDAQDSPEDLTWRVTSGDPDKVITTLLSNDVVRFTLIPNATGTAAVTFTLEDTDGMEVTTSININIIPSNDAPTIISKPPIITSSRTVYTYDAEAFDIDGDQVTFELRNAPTGMTIEPEGFNRAKVRWQPDKRGMTSPITIIVKDPLGLKGYHQWRIEVT